MVVLIELNFEFALESKICLCVLSFTVGKETILLLLLDNAVCSKQCSAALVLCIVSLAAGDAMLCLLIEQTESLAR